MIIRNYYKETIEDCGDDGGDDDGLVWCGLLFVYDIYYVVAGWL